MFCQLGGEESNMKNIACAVLAGSLSSAIANPTDVLKVRILFIFILIN